MTLTPTPRVSQLDSFILDKELYGLLLGNLKDIFKYFKPSLITYHSDELKLLLKLLLFRTTIWQYGSSYGMKLTNLFVSNNNKMITSKKKLLLLLCIVNGYVFKKLESYLYEPGSDNRVNKIKSTIISGLKLVKVLNFVSYLTFLVDGRFPDLLYRLLNLKISPIYDMKFNSSNVSFEFQNRQLVWNVLIEFLIFIIPIIKFKMPIRMLSRSNQEASTAIYQDISDRKCAICFQTNAIMSNPFATNCGHYYCYICILSKMNLAEQDNDRWRCLRCGEPVVWIKELDDIDETAILRKNNEQDTIEDEKESHQESDSEDESDFD